MPRAPRDAKLDTATARAKLQTRGEPYWKSIGEGLFIGYRKSTGSTSWIARQYVGGRYRETRIGTPDDALHADGEIVFTYYQAVERVRGVAKEIATPAPKHYGDGATLNDCFKFYREDYLRVDKPGAEEQAAAMWARHVENTIGPKLVAALTQTDYETWLRALAAKQAKRVKPGIDPATAKAARVSSANRVWTIVRAALNKSLKDSGPLKTDRMPWRNVKPLKGERGDEPPRMMDRDEITRLLNASEPDLRALLTGALMTGARYGELCALCVRDYDHENKRVVIRQTKTGKRLAQPLTGEGAAFFEALCAGRQPGEAMFKRADGSAWGVSHQHRPLKAAAAIAKVDGISFKATRATYGKLLLQATKDLELVAKALGHSDSRITRKHYAQLLPSEVAVGVAMMAPLGIETKTNVRRLRKTPSPAGMS